MEGNGGGYEKWWNETDIIMYDYTNGMNLHRVQSWKQNDVPHLCTMNQNAVCKKLKAK